MTAAVVAALLLAAELSVARFAFRSGLAPSALALVGRRGERRGGNGLVSDAAKPRRRRSR